MSKPRRSLNIRVHPRASTSPPSLVLSRIVEQISSYIPSSIFLILRILGNASFNFVNDSLFFCSEVRFYFPEGFRACMFTPEFDVFGACVQPLPASLAACRLDRVPLLAVGFDYFAGLRAEQPRLAFCGV
jgi:hypothetical protein